MKIATESFILRRVKWKSQARISICEPRIENRERETDFAGYRWQLTDADGYFIIFNNPKI